MLLAIVLIPTAWFTAVAVMAPPEALGGAVRALPNAASLVVIIAGLWFVARSRTRAQYSTAVLATALAVVPLLLAVAFLRPRGWLYEPSKAFLPLIAMYGAFPNTVGRQILPPLLLTAGLLAGRVFWFPAAGDGPVGDTLLLVVTNAIGIVMVMRRAELQRMVAGAYEELHALRGIIPICSHCKNVRTEADTWQQIEQYVRDHSAADFSHGICPSCIRTMYPDDADVAAPSPR